MTRGDIVQEVVGAVREPPSTAAMRLNGGTHAPVNIGRCLKTGRYRRVISSSSPSQLEYGDASLSGPVVIVVPVVCG